MFLNTIIAKLNSLCLTGGHRKANGLTCQCSEIDAKLQL